jgi:3-hydroxyacyl-CoA dehydrogenase
MDKIRQVGVLGAGTMGGGIAQTVAQAGFEVTLMDVSDQLLKTGIEKIEKNLSRNVEKGKLSLDEKTKILTRIKRTTNINEMKSCELIIEAVFEDLKLKENLLSQLEKICLPETVFASNTSTLSITKMAAGMSRPAKVLGLHFFNPVPVMRLVEVIPGLQTSREVIDWGVDFVKRIKKTPVEAKDCPGFLVNRIIMPYAGEAMLAAQEGAASPSEIDEAAKSAGFPMGPLTLNDMVGMDVGVHTFPIMHDAYGDRFPVPILFERLFKAGRLGVKSGKGIYTNGKVDEEFEQIVKKIQSDTGIKTSGFSVERLILRQVNEAIYCLQEKIATPEDIDRAMVLGTGFPVDDKGIGGPLHWADNKGLDWVLDRLSFLKGTLGNRFWPHPLLKQYVAAGYLGRKVKKGFFDYN